MEFKITNRMQAQFISFDWQVPITIYSTHFGDIQGEGSFIQVAGTEELFLNRRVKKEKWNSSLLINCILYFSVK